MLGEADKEPVSIEFFPWLIPQTLLSVVREREVYGSAEEKTVHFQFAFTIRIGIFLTWSLGAVASSVKLGKLTKCGPPPAWP